MITDYLVSFRSRHRSTKFCQTWRRSLHVTQRLGTMARFGILHLLDLRALHSDQGKFIVGLNLVGSSLTKLVSCDAVSHSSPRHPRSARSAVRTCRNLCRRKSEFERYRSRSKSHLCWVSLSPAFSGSPTRADVLVSLQILPKHWSTQPKWRCLSNNQVRCLLYCLELLLTDSLSMTERIKPSTSTLPRQCSSINRHQNSFYGSSLFSLLESTLVKLWRSSQNGYSKVSTPFAVCLSHTVLTISSRLVAPHFFKPADLEASSGTKKGQINAKAQGASQLPRQG